MPTRPRKRFSQNFLVDRHYVERIVAAIGPRSGDRIVEIGPGRGALTRPLLEHVPRLTAIEIDRDLAAALGRELGERIALIIADALTVDFATLGPDLRVVGNLPYHISSPLLFHAAQAAERIVDMHFMLQAEVVERMTATPGTPEYGRLSVTIQSLFAAHKLFRVPPGAFFPAPAVDSAVVRLLPLGSARPRIDDRARFEAVVSAGFGQRRKTLRNALAGLVAPPTLASLGIDPGLRAETLSVAQFAAIANATTGNDAGSPAES